MADSKQSQEELNNLSNQLHAAEQSLKAVHRILDEMGIKPEDLPKPSPRAKQVTHDSENLAGKVIEGRFDGQNMIGPGEKTYPVPANYASKSKLVEGDILKLTISDDGSFIYKQIGPVERKKLIGHVVLDNGQYLVEAGGHRHKVLFASITYFKAQPGDEVTIVIPVDGEAHWAAIEAVIG